MTHRMPTFLLLLREARHRSDDVDSFDLHSEDAESRKTFGGLVHEFNKSVQSLLDYVKRHDDEISDELTEI